MLLEGSLHQVPDPVGSGRGKRAPVRLGGERGREDVRESVTPEDLLAGETLEEDTAQSEEVGALIEWLTADLLRTHVARCAHGEPGARVKHVRLRVGDDHVDVPRRSVRVHRDSEGGGLREAEVEDLGGSLGVDQDIGGLEVAMDDLAPVSRDERRGDLPGDAQRIVDIQRTVRQPIGETSSLDVLEHEKFPSVFRLLQAVDRRDMRMVEPGQDPRFPLESRELLFLLRQLAREDLDGDGPIELRVAGAVHDPHASPAQLFLDGVATDLLWNVHAQSEAQSCETRRWAEYTPRDPRLDRRGERDREKSRVAAIIGAVSSRMPRGCNSIQGTGAVDGRGARTITWESHPPGVKGFAYASLDSADHRGPVRGAGPGWAEGGLARRDDLYGLTRLSRSRRDQRFSYFVAVSLRRETEAGADLRPSLGVPSL